MKEKLSWITGLKGVAALVILIHHFALFFYPGFIYTTPDNIRISGGLELKIAQTPFNIFSWGGVTGVCIFFTISGFLIAYNYYKKDKKYDSNYMIKRYIKLMLPILISSIIIFIIVKSQIFRTESLMELYRRNGLNNSYTYYNENIFTLIWNSLFTLFKTASCPINPPMWTMKNELIYSLLSALLINVTGKSKYRFIIYSIIFLLFINTYYICFILGIVLCDIWINKKNIINYLNRLDIKIILLLSGLLLLSSTYANQFTAYYSTINNLFEEIDYIVFYHSIGSAFILLFFLLTLNAKKLFSKKVLLFLGEQSLFIYLFHWVIINTFSMFIVVKLNKYLKYYQSCLISLVLSFILIILMSKYFGKYITAITSWVVKKIK